MSTDSLQVPRTDNVNFSSGGACSTAWEMDRPRVQSTVQVRVGAAEAGASNVMATKKAATLAARRDAIVIAVSFDHEDAASIRDTHGLEAETRISVYQRHHGKFC